MSWWDLEEPKKETKEEIKERALCVKYDKIICEKLTSANNITSFSLNKGEQLRLVTNNSMNAISIISHCISNYELSEIYIVVYRMNLRAVAKIREFAKIDGIKLNIVLSSFFRENKKYEKWCRELVNFSETNENINTVFDLSHAKITLIKTKCGKYIVFEGSGNLSDNARIEQYSLEDNQEVYDFHKQWIDEIIKDKKI